MKLSPHIVSKTINLRPTKQIFAVKDNKRNNKIPPNTEDLILSRKDKNEYYYY